MEYFRKALSTFIAIPRKELQMARDKQRKALTSDPCNAAGVARSISAGRPTEIGNKIHQRAYELYSARGREPGRELEDWLRAEIEVLGSKPSGWDVGRPTW
jgi:hypothetical protein